MYIKDIEINFQAHLPKGKGLGNSIRVPKSFTFKMKLQNRSCKNEFYLHEKKSSFSPISLAFHLALL